jgi:hypothetical protein
VSDAPEPAARAGRDVPEPGGATSAGPVQAASQPGRSLAQPAAVIDDAHLGDIEGALGRIRLDDQHSSGLRRRLVTFLAIVGLGVLLLRGYLVVSVLLLIVKAVQLGSG